MATEQKLQQATESTSPWGVLVGVLGFALGVCAAAAIPIALLLVVLRVFGVI